MNGLLGVNHFSSGLLSQPQRMGAAFTRTPEGWTGTDREWGEHPGRQLAGVIEAGSNLPGIPTNVRLLGESLAMSPGERKENPITAKDYTSEELDAIKDLIRRRIKAHERVAEMDQADLRSTNPLTRFEARRSIEEYADKPLSGEVSYDTYRGYKHPGLGWAGETLHAPGLIKSSLGKFKFRQLPNGDIEVTDDYDFEDYNELARFELRQAQEKARTSNPGLLFDLASMPRRKY